MVITFLCSSLETCIPFFGKETNNNNNNKTVRLSRAMHDSRSTPCMRLSGRKPNCPRFFTTVAVCLALDFFMLMMPVGGPILLILYMTFWLLQ